MQKYKHEQRRGQKETSKSAQGMTAHARPAVMCEQKGITLQEYTCCQAYANYCSRPISLGTQHSAGNLVRFQTRYR